MKKESRIKIFITIFLVLMVFILIFNRALVKFKNYLDEKFLPFQSKVYSSADKIMEIKNIIFSYRDIIEENEKLKRENMELKFENSSKELILEENIRLTNLLEMKEANKNTKGVKFARVIFRDANNINKKFYIDLGYESGIEKNMLVMYDDFLVGRVVEVYRNFSMILMITDNNSRISVKSASNLLGISQGSDEDKAEMYFQPSTFEETLELGEEIFTSGISDIYPEGLKIGNISEINKSDNNLFKSIKIKPKFDSKDLKEVMLYKYELDLKKK